MSYAIIGIGAAITLYFGFHALVIYERIQKRKDTITRLDQCKKELEDAISKGEIARARSLRGECNVLAAWLQDNL